MIRSILFLLCSLLIFEDVMAQSPLKANKLLASSYLEKAIAFEKDQLFDSMYIYVTKGYELFGVLQLPKQQAECAVLMYSYETNLGRFDSALKHANASSIYNSMLKGLHIFRRKFLSNKLINPVDIMLFHG